MSDIIAAMDQAAENGRQTARPIVAFYQQLSEAEMDEQTKGELTIIYARRLLRVKEEAT